jgi:hypothetical protein
VVLFRGLRVWQGKLFKFLFLKKKKKKTKISSFVQEEDMGRIVSLFEQRTTKKTGECFIAV